MTGSADNDPSDATGLERLLRECRRCFEEGGAEAAEAFLAAQGDATAELRRRFERLRALDLLPSALSTPRALPDRLGPFRLLERLGGGGMGVVFRAIQEPLGREV